MKTTIIRLPDGLHNALSARGKNLNTVICSLLAESLGVDYTPPKRGGRRIPRDITSEEIALIQGQGVPSPKPAATPQPAKPPAPKQSTGAQDDVPLKLNMETLAQQGYPYAETTNGAFTGRLSAVALAGYTYVGKMTLAEFQRRAGKRAFVG